MISKISVTHRYHKPLHARCFNSCKFYPPLPEYSIHAYHTLLCVGFSYFVYKELYKER
jgi:hypothetical protein